MIYFCLAEIRVKVSDRMLRELRVENPDNILLLLLEFLLLLLHLHEVVLDIDLAGQLFVGDLSEL